MSTGLAFLVQKLFQMLKLDRLTEAFDGVCLLNVSCDSSLTIRPELRIHRSPAETQYASETGSSRSPKRFSCLRAERASISQVVSIDLARISYY
jgi:hypothetical protein